MDMQSEITVEVTCTKKKLFELLEKNGFFFKERLHITDYYFTHFDVDKLDIGFRQLAKNSCLIRDVKLERKYFGSDGITNLLYKRKEIDAQNRVQSEQKIACPISNANQAKRIFTLMGLKNWCTKKMTGYVFKKGDFEMLVQEIEGFGLFIEIEQFENQKDDTQQKILNRLIRFVNGLEIPIKPDYHVNIAYAMYMHQRYPEKKPAPKKPATKPTQPKPATPKIQPATKPEPKVTPKPTLKPKEAPKPVTPPPAPEPEKKAKKGLFRKK